MKRIIGLTIIFTAALLGCGKKNEPSPDASFYKKEKASKSSFCKMEEHDYDFKAIEKALCR